MTLLYSRGSFLPPFLSLSALSTFPLFLVPQRIGIRGANLGGGGPRGEVGQSGGNGGVGQKVGGRRRHGQRTLQLLHGQTLSLGIGQFTFNSF